MAKKSNKPEQWMSGALLASGGIDSVVLLYFLKALGRLDHVLFVDYGQANAANQLDALTYHTERLGLVEPVTIDCPIPDEYKGDAFQGRKRMFKNGGFKPDKVWDCRDWKFGGGEASEFPQNHPYWKKAAIDFVPLRNMRWWVEVFCWASHHACPNVYWGPQYEKSRWDWGDPFEVEKLDNGVVFTDLLNQLAPLSWLPKPVKVFAPWLDIKADKSHIVNLGIALGVDMTKTYTCEGYPPCERCRQCNNRRLAIERQKALTEHR